MSRTIKELAQEALDVQNASNLSGVVLSFAKVIQELKELSVYDRRHPIVLAWVDKINSLTGTQGVDWEVFSDAFSAVERLAGVDR